LKKAPQPSARRRYEYQHDRATPCRRRRCRRRGDRVATLRPSRRHSTPSRGRRRASSRHALATYGNRVRGRGFLTPRTTPRFARSGNHRGCGMLRARR